MVRQSGTGCLLGVFAVNMSHFLFAVTNGLYFKAGNKERCTLNIDISLKGEDFSVCPLWSGDTQMWSLRSSEG